MDNTNSVNQELPMNMMLSLDLSMGAGHRQLLIHIF